MSERSVKCPACPFSFAALVDAGDYHAYVCPDCDWSKPTIDRRPGNRPGHRDRTGWHMVGCEMYEAAS